MLRPGQEGDASPPPITEVGVDSSRQQERDAGCGEQFAAVVVPDESPNLFRNDSEAADAGSDVAALMDQDAGPNCARETSSFCRTLSEPCALPVRFDPSSIEAKYPAQASENPPGGDGTGMVEIPRCSNRRWSGDGDASSKSSRHGGKLKGVSLDSDVLKRMLEIDDRRSILGSRRLESTVGGNFGGKDDVGTQSECQMADKVATSWRDAGAFGESFTKRRRSNAQSGGGLQRQDRFILPSGTLSFDVRDDSTSPFSIANLSSKSFDSAFQCTDPPHDIRFSTSYSKPNLVDPKEQSRASSASSFSSVSDPFSMWQTPDTKPDSKHWESDDEIFEKAMISCSTAIDLGKIQAGLALI